MEDVDLVVGVDTHLDSHTAAICDQRGRLLAERQVPTTPAGYADLADWVSEAAGEGQVVWAIEGSRHYGLGLSRFLRPAANGWWRSTAAVISANDGQAKATRSTPSGPPKSCWPGPNRSCHELTVTGKHCGC